MYRQVWIHPDERRYQRIFWLHANKIQVFQLNTVTFGVSSAPFLAVRTIQKLANDESSKFPIGARTLHDDFYVDDLLSGANTLKELIHIRDEVIEILKRGGFDIRQWASNHPRALENLPERLNDLEFLIDENPIRKTLGISWNAQHDELFYTVKTIERPNKITKRFILSEIAKIFDPLGLLGPVMLVSKILLQQCWKAKTGWDESVPHALQMTWQSFSEQLTLIDNLEINRNVLINDAIDIQFHGFSDASKAGYGGCIYVRSSNQNNEILVRLLCSKGRVAPPAGQTIPRLELCGALMLAQLYNEIHAIFASKPNKIVF